MLDVNCCSGGTRATLATSALDGERFIRLLRMSVSRRYIRLRDLLGVRCRAHVPRRSRLAPRPGLSPPPRPTLLPMPRPPAAGKWGPPPPFKGAPAPHPRGGQRAAPPASL